jgi:hypothetical protein
MYLSLMEQGYKLNEIDEMDIIYYLRLVRKKANKQTEKQFAYIDQIF